MADVDVAQWLEQWVEEHLAAHRRAGRKAEVHDQARACAEEARSAGISIAEIEEAADGDLESYLLQRQNAATDREERGDGPHASAVAGSLEALVPAGIPIAIDDAFQDRTLELEEFAEELVVLKEARVVEEITLRRTGRDRIETVRAAVRRTEVEIEEARERVTATTGLGIVDAVAPDPAPDPSRRG